MRLVFYSEKAVIFLMLLILYKNKARVDSQKSPTRESLFSFIESTLRSLFNKSYSFSLTLNLIPKLQQQYGSKMYKDTDPESRRVFDVMDRLLKANPEMNPEMNSDLPFDEWKIFVINDPDDNACVSPVSYFVTGEKKIPVII